MRPSRFKRIEPIAEVEASAPDEIFTNRPSITPEFLLAGKATFEVVNTATCERMAFKVRKLSPPRGPSRYHVNVISVPFEQTRERYIGSVDPKTGFIRTDTNSKFLPEAKEYRTAAWAIQAVLLGKTIPHLYVIRQH